MKLSEIEESINWRKFTPDLQTYIKSGKITSGTTFESLAQRPFVLKWLEYFKKFYHTGGYYAKPRWDRVCVTTLFTFYWDITIDTIEFAKRVCKNSNQVLVGGILASVVPEKLRETTGIQPYEGCLYDKMLCEDTPIDREIDALPLDYSILEEIDYQYPVTGAYYAYTTRGCVNKCKFCAVPTLEPGPMKYFPLKEKLKEIQELFGEQRHLLLMDNNVFASDKFDTIIEEICDSGSLTMLPIFRQTNWKSPLDN